MLFNPPVVDGSISLTSSLTLFLLLRLPPANMVPTTAVPLEILLRELETSPGCWQGKKKFEAPPAAFFIPKEDDSN